MNYARIFHHTASSARMLAIMLVLMTAPGIVPAQNKMTVEQVVAKHLESIGADNARRSASRIVFGTCSTTFRGVRTGTITGRAVLASESSRSLIGVSFQSPSYPHEKLGYDGEKFRTGFITPGVRSALGTFILDNDEIYKGGLVGGTLSSAWALLNLPAKEAKLEYAGTEKFNDRAAHKIKYTPRRGSDLQTTLYFDTENFRHVRTRYERVVGAGIGAGVNASAGLRETRYQLVENFSEFKKENGLTLPHKYQLELFIDSTRGTIDYKYLLDLQQFSFNQEIGKEFFNAEIS